jgi:hypothetical protein
VIQSMPAPMLVQVRGKAEPGGTQGTVGVGGEGGGGEETKGKKHAGKAPHHAHEGSSKFDAKLKVRTDLC